MKCTLLCIRVVPNKADVEFLDIRSSYEFRVLGWKTAPDGKRRNLYLPGKLRLNPNLDIGINNAKKHLEEFGFTEIAVEYSAEQL